MLSVNHAPVSLNKYMTTIYYYFRIKNKSFFFFFLSKKIIKICSRTHQTAPFKIFSREACPRTPYQTPRVASSFAACNSPSHQKVRHPLANHTYSTPMEIYLRRCARSIHDGRQFIVCSTSHVYALQNFFRGKND